MATGHDMVIGDDGWLEIVGEQTRGGGSPAVAGMDPSLAYEVLGDAMTKSAAFKQYVDKRVAASRPVVSRSPLNKARDYNIDFGPVSGSTGTTTVITVRPQIYFRAEKVMATDDGGSKAAGYNTRITQILVGAKSQRPVNAGSGTLTYFFANGALGNGVKWDT